MDPLPPAAFLDVYPAPMAAIARLLQGVVHHTFPNAIERVRPGWHLIGYDLPAGRRSVYFAYIAPEAEHVHLGFRARLGDARSGRAPAGPGRHQAGPLADLSTG